MWKVERFFVECFYTKDDYFPAKTDLFLSQKAAENCAKRYAQLDEYYSVTIRFHRPSDGQTGYINRGSGASFEAENWV